MKNELFLKKNTDFSDFYGLAQIFLTRRYEEKIDKITGLTEMMF